MGPLESAGYTPLYHCGTIQVRIIYLITLTSQNICRKHHELASPLSSLEVEKVTQVTSCQKPCRYRRFGFVGNKQTTMFRLEDFFVVSLWPISSTTRLEKEELIYPFASLVAEFGGTLGLFLGFSFMTLWDGLESISKMGRVLTNLFPCFKTHL